MVGVITGDIINSRAIAPSIWIPLLEECLHVYGVSPKNWEIYRGDAFQLEIPIEQVFEAIFMIKSSIKRCKDIDVRMSVGIGNKEFETDKITMSNGSVFINSGEAFDRIDKRKLSIKSNSSTFDDVFNLICDVFELKMENWTKVEAELVFTALTHSDWNQKQIASYLSKSQSNVSEGMKRAGFDELKKINEFYKKIY